MISFKSRSKYYNDAEEMASAYLSAYYGNSEIEYPISPFKMLNDEKVLFLIRNFNKLEGVYIPAQSEEDVAMVGINANRPITRQRFTAAHELCHHFRDADKQVSCPIGQKNAT
jgi:Zn-dependent peptidase ImmA (M78 family)